MVISFHMIIKDSKTNFKNQAHITPQANTNNFMLVLTLNNTLTWTNMPLIIKTEPAPLTSLLSKMIFINSLSIWDIMVTKILTHIPQPQVVVIQSFLKVIFITTTTKEIQINTYTLNNSSPILTSNIVMASTAIKLPMDSHQIYNFRILKISIKASQTIHIQGFLNMTVKIIVKTSVLANKPFRVISKSLA